MSNKGLLILLGVILLGVFAIIVVDAAQEPNAPGEQIANAANETSQVIGNTDDNT